MHYKRMLLHYSLPLSDPEAIWEIFVYQNRPCVASFSIKVNKGMIKHRVKNSVPF